MLMRKLRLSLISVCVFGVCPQHAPFNRHAQQIYQKSGFKIKQRQQQQQQQQKQQLARVLCGRTRRMRHVDKRFVTTHNRRR